MQLQKGLASTSLLAPTQVDGWGSTIIGDHLPKRSHRTSSHVFQDVQIDDRHWQAGFKKQLHWLVGAK